MQVKVLRKIMRTYLGLLRTYSPFLLSLLALKSVIFFSIDVVFSIGISNLYVSTIQVLLNQVETTNKKDLKISYNATVVAEFCKSLWWISARSLHRLRFFLEKAEKIRRSYPLHTSKKRRASTDLSADIIKIRPPVVMVPV